MKYELTITLKPTMYQFNPKEQLRLTKDKLLNIFYPNNKQEYMVSCVAELTQEHNVHYHCIIELQDIQAKDRLLNKFRSLTKIFGKKSCTQVQYEDSYKQYLIKDLEKTRSLIGDPIICDYYGVAKSLFNVT